MPYYLQDYSSSSHLLTEHLSFVNTLDLSSMHTAAAAVVVVEPYFLTEQHLPFFVKIKIC